MLEVANTAFAESDIDLRLNLAGLVSLDIPTELQETLLPKMRKGESPFTTTEADRSFYDADLAVALLHSVPEDDDACGAYVLASNIHNSKSSGASSVFSFISFKKDDAFPIAIVALAL